ncbi:MAG: hypothetical protein K0S74_108 [Chlamydiales bacterium]|jgi:hypothetical protein|nr:hypothetical protein [Chlamydiales bacterium]
MNLYNNLHPSEFTANYVSTAKATHLVPFSSDRIEPLQNHFCNNLSKQTIENRASDLIQKTVVSANNIFYSNNPLGKEEEETASLDKKEIKKLIEQDSCSFRELLIADGIIESTHNPNLTEEEEEVLKNLVVATKAQIDLHRKLSQEELNSLIKVVMLNILDKRLEFFFRMQLGLHYINGKMYKYAEKILIEYKGELEGLKKAFYYQCLAIIYECLGGLPALTCVYNLGLVSSEFVNEEQKLRTLGKLHLLYEALGLSSIEEAAKAKLTIAQDFFHRNSYLDAVIEATYVVNIRRSIPHHIRAKAFFYIGASYHATSQYQKAFDYLQTCIKLDPKHEQANVLLNQTVCALYFAKS